MLRLALVTQLFGLIAATGLPLQHDYGHASWQEIGKANADVAVVATLYLKQDRIEHAKDIFERITDPTSAHFGQHLSRAEADALFAPSARALDAVTEWLNVSNVARQTVRSTRNTDMVQFTSTVEVMNKLFRAPCSIYARDSEQHVSCRVPHPPAGLAPYVDHVLINDSPHVLSRKRSPAAEMSNSLAGRDAPSSYTTSPNLSRCAESWTPECIRQLYQVPLEHKAAPNNSLGLYAYGDKYVASDISAFFKRFASFIPQNSRPTKVKINAGTADYTIGEVNLDIEMAWPIVYPQNLTVFQVDDIGSLQFPGFGNHFLDAVDGSYCHKDGGDDPDYDPIYPNFSYKHKADCGTVNITNVVSISYATDEVILSPHYVRRQCNEWMKLALQGVSVLAASGDHGVQGGQYCGNPVPGTDYRGFEPLFPASCPYVTAVGATQVNFTSNGKTWKEVAVYDYPHKFWSGGGFSAVNSRPSWQNDAVTAYFKSNVSSYPNGTFNTQGRGIPDVAMLGALVAVVDQGNITVSGGTSAATPLFAAMINRINDERLLAGKRPIGFLNKILYKHPEVFRDITEGSNPGCGAPGFNATKGWDPVSGLGSAVYPKLRDLLVNLP